MTYKKEIPLNGLSTSPSDYQSTDGDSSVAVGLVHEDSSMCPMSGPSIILRSCSKEEASSTGRYNEQVLYIHKNGDYENVIFRYTRYSNDVVTYGFSPRKNLVDGSIIEQGDDGVLTWNEFSSGRYSILGGKDVKTITSIGNILIFYCEGGVFYFRFDENNKYIYIGDNIPDVSLSFGLLSKKGTEKHMTLSEKISKDAFKRIEVDWDDSSKTGFIQAVGSDNIKLVQDAIIGAANKLVSDITYLGYFSMPFFVRYALRLYDESLVMHSAPVLMIPCSGCTPVCSVEMAGTEELRFNMSSALFRLIFKINQSHIDKLVSWNEIVKSIDIFVSLPIYTYDETALSWDRTYMGNYQDLYVYGSETEEYKSVAEKMFSICNYYKGNEELHYQKRNYIYNMLSGAHGYEMIFLPERNSNDILRDVKECGQFYLLKSIDIKELNDGMNVIPAAKRGYLSSLSEKELMTDDYDSHDTNIPMCSLVYNSRQNMSSIKKIIYEGYNASSIFNYTDGYNDGWIGTIENEGDGKINVSVYYKILSKGKDIIVKGESGMYGNKSPFLYLYYPNTDAYKAIIVIDNSIDNTKKAYEIPLVKHESLNGSYFFGGFYFDIYKDADEVEIPEEVSSIEYRTINIPNEIRTSELDNPFVFKAKNVEYIGSGQIISLVPAAQALSSGQFGDFPMYAFTTDGVWALSVSETGGWKSKQPISRDVALNKDMILQLDQQVLFATDRGLMLISGSNIECITEIFDGNPDNFLRAAKSHITSILGAHSDISYQDAPPFREFIRDGNMHYDYKNQRIIIGNKKHRFCYIFNMKDKMWTSEQLKLSSALNSYPDALAVAVHEGRNLLVNLSDTSAYSAITPSDGFILTRPLKLDYPDQYKTIRTVIVRGDLDTNSSGKTPGSVDIILFASRDMNSWLVIGSTRGDRLTLHHGTPYKYFRVGLITHLGSEESISGLTVEYEVKQTRRLR